MKNWKPQPYRQVARELDVSTAVLDAAIAVSNLVVNVDKSLPPILTLRHLAHLTKVGYKDLRGFVSRRDYESYRNADPYKVFRIRKRRRRGRPQGFRTICVPEVKLKIAQQWIAKNVLRHGRPHSASTAFEVGATLFDAALPHCGSKWLIKIDIQRFFESVSEIAVYHAFRRLGYQPLVSFELSRICTRLGPLTRSYHDKRWFRITPFHRNNITNYSVNRLGHLPQGAPTSPMLANLVMFETDEELSKIAQAYGLIYTRYADDLTFSTNCPNFNRNIASEVIVEVYKTLGRFGFNPNLAKTKISPPRARKIVLGLLVDLSTPRLTRKFKNTMRQHLYYLEHKEIGPVKHAGNR